MVRLPLLLLAFSLHTVTLTASPASIWEINIDRSPAPPPDLGPPASAGALRDPTKLKYEIAGIVAAYALWIIITVILLLFVGLRLRRRVLSVGGSLVVEMVKPRVVSGTNTSGGQDFGMAHNSPLNPSRMSSAIRSWTRGSKNTDSKITITSVDEKVLEQDKAKNMDAMAKLYAAVMAHDELRSQASNSDIVSPVSPRSPKSPQYPQELDHLRIPNTYSNRVAPIAATEESLPESKPSSPRSTRKHKVSPLSFASSHRREDSTNSISSRPSRISIRGKEISQPMGSADLRDSPMYEDSVPLSPRFYDPGPPPPTPKYPATTSRDSEKRSTPAALQLRSPAASSSGSLPFRQMFAEPTKSAPPTKTTFLDRKITALNNGARTGVPPTPYSPYTPFTPITPITPRRLVTREDLKQQKRREALKVLNEDDLVKSDDEIWSP